MKKLLTGLGLLAVLALLLASLSCAGEATKESPPNPPTVSVPPVVLAPPAAPGFIWGSGADEGKGTVVLVNTDDSPQRRYLAGGGGRGPGYTGDNRAGGGL